MSMLYSCGQHCCMNGYSPLILQTGLIMSAGNVCIKLSMASCFAWTVPLNERVREKIC